MSDLVPVFVYGTLRPGDYNHGRFPGGVAHVDEGCKTNGRLYHAFARANYRSYPGVRFDEDGVVHGDVLWYRADSDALRSVVSMELGAGYSIVEIKVENAKGEHMEVLAFQYESDHGPRIESGDWFAPDAYPATGASDLSAFAEDEYGEDWGDDDWYEDDDIDGHLIAEDEED